MESQPHNLKDALRELMRTSVALKHRRSDSEAATVWTEVAGPELAGHTSVRGVRLRVMTVAVDGAPLCHELAAFRRFELVAQINARLKRAPIDDIHFRVGTI